MKFVKFFRKMVITKIKEKLPIKIHENAKKPVLIPKNKITSKPELLTKNFVDANVAKCFKTAKIEKPGNHSLKTTNSTSTLNTGEQIKHLFS